MIGNVTSISGAPNTDSKSSDLEKLKAVAKQFEAVFLRQILSSARQSKLGDDIMGSDATDQFRDMQDARLADNMADKGVFGVADLLVKQFAARVGGSTPAADATAKPAEAQAETK
ncbi:rod-binding protein [Sphingomonas montanisoli]|uniref:Rod-binding protein n=1 Tax=Sphingomonas montanisoli TaxID=2606412 RepID=A0A5D9C547_9SPHN|nr:rod-binding protein [Sphingomonas montanisoli]TZG25105.1 rod-binding protein [Sphingomonas montanisoli]